MAPARLPRSRRRSRTLSDRAFQRIPDGRQTQQGQRVGRAVILRVVGDVTQRAKKSVKALPQENETLWFSGFGFASRGDQAAPAALDFLDRPGLSKSYRRLDDVKLVQADETQNAAKQHP